MIANFFLPEDGSFTIIIYIYLKKNIVFITERIMSSENNPMQLQPSDLNNLLQSIITKPYQESVCGSILLPLATNSPSEIFSYLRHGQFDKFRRCLDVYYKEIIQMKNEHGQVNKFAFINFLY
jgi:hypothetical protein